MSNSPLVDYTKISPNSSARTSGVLKITPHHMAGNLSVEACGEGFALPSRQASSTYAIGTDGRVGQYVDESRRPWTSSSTANDNQAVTIEVANDGGAPDWRVSDKALAKLIELCADICQRNGIKKLVYDGTANGNLTRHNMFAATACPGPYLQSKFPYIAEEVNKKLNNQEDDDMVRYARLSDIPNDNGFRDIINTLMNAKIINGDGSDPVGNNSVIDLSHDQVRSLVFEYRGGAFDRKLISAGMAPVVAG